MNQLTIKIVHENGEIAASKSDTDEVTLAYLQTYIPGDKIVIETQHKGMGLVIQVDDALGEAMVYANNETFVYTIPFGEKRISYSPKVFYGCRHLLSARLMTREETYAYRNQALNVMDQPADVGVYPHATANVETRGEAVFAARNAIDGVKETGSHGEWPFESWGINRQEDANMVVDFGRDIKADKMRLYTRSDFPHDNWWVQVTIAFSDGTSILWNMEKSHKAHELIFEPKTIRWVCLENMIKSEDPSPFPALTQIEVYGTQV